MENYYKILSVNPKASQADIKERFRFLANAYHPDKFTSSIHKTQAEAEFKKINEAYQVLSAPLKRAEYDRKFGLTHSSQKQAPKPHDAPINRALRYGQSLITSFISIMVLSFAIYIARGIGLWGIILVLILAATIYFKVWK